MTAAEREHWAEESVQAHVANVVNAWWDVKTADGKSVDYDLDAVAEQE
ncbi:MAG: hypothetical protein HOY79_06300 [Streptomyces sp.]|nr:hypothetical protein [Streptomyces sp.]